MFDEEVEVLLQEIRDEVKANSQLSKRSGVGNLLPENGNSEAFITSGPSDDLAYTSRLESYLTTTARAWDRLPPIISNRHGVAARLELWLKSRLRTLTRWFTWEQVNFNAAVHHVLHDLIEELKDDRRRFVDTQIRVADKIREESQSTQSMIEGQQETLEKLRAEFWAEVETSQTVFGSELRANAEAQQNEFERQRADIKNLRAILEAQRSSQAELLDHIAHLRKQDEQIRASQRLFFKQFTVENSGGATKPATNLFVEPRVVNDLSECFFYHSMDLPSYGSVEGHWDLRGQETQYLGNVSFAGKRVLEIGPASGHLTFFMEREGAQVVSVEAAEDYHWEFCWEVPDETPAELSEKLTEHRKMMSQLRNSYWLAHGAFQSRALIHYGSAYSIPLALGQFDVSVIACVLLHCKSPLQILESCARSTKETVVIVEAFREQQLSQSPVVFQASAKEQTWHTWWSFSPVYFVDILRSMGFPHHQVTFHRQLFKGEPTDLFTVVASRNPIVEASKGDQQVGIELSSNVETLKVEAGKTIKVPVSLINTGAVPLSNSANNPVVFSYHWKSVADELLVWDGLRTPLIRTLYPGDREHLLLSVLAPPQPGEFFLDVTLLQENVTWFEDLGASLPLRIKTIVI